MDQLAGDLDGEVLAESVVQFLALLQPVHHVVETGLQVADLVGEIDARLDELAAGHAAHLVYQAVQRLLHAAVDAGKAAEQHPARDGKQERQVAGKNVPGHPFKPQEVDQDEGQDGETDHHRGDLYVDRDGEARPEPGQLLGGIKGRHQVLLFREVRVDINNQQRRLRQEGHGRGGVLRRGDSAGEQRAHA